MDHGGCVVLRRILSASVIAGAVAVGIVAAAGVAGAAPAGAVAAEAGESRVAGGSAALPAEWHYYGYTQDYDLCVSTGEYYVSEGTWQDYRCDRWEWADAWILFGYY